MRKPKDNGREMQEPEEIQPHAHGCSRRTGHTDPHAKGLLVSAPLPGHHVQLSGQRKSPRHTK